MEESAAARVGEDERGGRGAPPGHGLALEIGRRPLCNKGQALPGVAPGALALIAKTSLALLTLVPRKPYKDTRDRSKPAGQGEQAGLGVGGGTTAEHLCLKNTWLLITFLILFLFLPLHS